MNILILIPKPGRRVLDPAQTPPAPLPPEGRKVVDSPYWRSRLADGVVTRLSPGPTPANEAPALDAPAEAGRSTESEPPSSSMAKPSAANKGVQGPPAPGKK